MYGGNCCLLQKGIDGLAPLLPVIYGCSSLFCSGPTEAATQLHFLLIALELATLSFINRETQSLEGSLGATLVLDTTRFAATEQLFPSLLRTVFNQWRPAGPGVSEIQEGLKSKGTLMLFYNPATGMAPLYFVLCLSSNSRAKHHKRPQKFHQFQSWTFHFDVCSTTTCLYNSSSTILVPVKTYFSLATLNVFMALGRVCSSGPLVVFHGLCKRG